MRSYPAYEKIIHVEFRAFPAFFWLAAGFEVRIGGRVFHPRLDGAKFFVQPLTEFDFDHQGKRISGMVRGVGPWWFVVNKRYSLVVGLSELARDTQRMRGWPLAYLAVLIFWLVVALAVAGAYFVGLAAWARLHPYYRF